MGLLIDTFECLLFALRCIGDADGAVVTDPGQCVSRWRECHAVHPATTVFMLQKHFTKRHLGSPWSWAGFVLNFLNVRGENSAKSEIKPIRIQYRILYFSILYLYIWIFIFQYFSLHDLFIVSNN